MREVPRLTPAPVLSPVTGAGSTRHPLSSEDIIITVNAIAATSASEPLVRTTVERRDVGPRDVLIEIRYAGVCHSDIHTVRGSGARCRTR
ncbi:hypothetical protein Misp04_39920 [Micromonospora sp. NBRC 101691]|nr:hypothetical protein Misp04_39920 [Micromonospora sp. NBRC 101691]